MQQQGGNTGPPRFPNPDSSKAPAQLPPYAVPGSISRPGAPSWQGTPPDPQFRPHIPNPSFSSAPPGTLGDPLRNTNTPLPAGPPAASFYSPDVSRPSGAPRAFQASRSMQPSSAPSLQPHGPSAAGPFQGPNRPPSSFSTAGTVPMGILPRLVPQGSMRFDSSSVPPSGFAGPARPQGPEFTPSAQYPPMSGPPIGAFPTSADARPLFNKPSEIPPSQGGHFGPSPPQAQPGGHQFSPMLQQPTSAYRSSIPAVNVPHPLQVSSTLDPPQYAPPSSQGYYTGPLPSSMSGQNSNGQAGAYGPPPSTGVYGTNYQQQAQGLVEDFQSLSIVPVPGSGDNAVDSSTLPRPFDGAEEVKSTGTFNCHPRYLRLTNNSMPNAHALVARWHLPLGAVTCPLAEAPPGEDIPVVNFVGTSIVRCSRCRTYINAYVRFTDGGQRWCCNVCLVLNEVPAEYFCALDENGRRQDVQERPELSCGTVEYVASTEYMVRPPMPPVYFFLIDVSTSAVKSGMLKAAAETIKATLDRLPGFPRTQIGFVTFDSSIHFYNLKSSLTQPQMMVVSDLDDPFLPLPDDLLVNLSESRVVVDALLDSLPSMFENNLNIESALGPALRATFMIMSQLGGKLLLFQSILPSLGVGRLKLRGDDPRIYGTVKEPQLRTTEEQFYKQMAADLSKFQIGVNIYAFSDKYTDLASLGTLAKYTGGQVYYYPGFQADLHGQKFKYELARDLSRETAWEAVLRIRCGKGIRFSSFHGHFTLTSTDLMSLPAMDCDKAFAMQLVLEDTLLTSQTVYFQVALLYTSSFGERRIRVHTMATPVVTDLSELYRSADVGAITCLMSRLAVEKTLQSKLEDARQAIQQRLVRSLREYRSMYAVQHRTSNRLIFPGSLELLPLYTLAIMKNMAIRGGYEDCTPDERSTIGFEIMTMPISRLLKLLYPMLMKVDEYLIQDGKPDSLLALPASLPLSSANLDPCGTFLFNDGLQFVLWLGKVLPDKFVNEVLGTVGSSNDYARNPLTAEENAVSKRLASAFHALRESNPAVYQLCLAVRQGEQPREGKLLLSNLLEDRTVVTCGYSDFVVQVFHQVSQKTS